jgi:hypothetical protein
MDDDVDCHALALSTIGAENLFERREGTDIVFRCCMHLWILLIQSTGGFWFSVLLSWRGREGATVATNSFSLQGIW